MQEWNKVKKGIINKTIKLSKQHNCNKTTATQQQETNTYTHKHIQYQSWRLSCLQVGDSKGKPLSRLEFKSQLHSSTRALAEALTGVRVHMPAKFSEVLRGSVRSAPSTQLDSFQQGTAHALPTSTSWPVKSSNVVVKTLKLLVVPRALSKWRGVRSGKGCAECKKHAGTCMPSNIRKQLRETLREPGRPYQLQTASEWL